MSNLLTASFAYAGAAAILTMIPGPDTAVVLSSAVAGGRRAAARAALGVGAGLLVWGVAASAGISAALHSSATIYAVFRFGCALYLLYLGIALLVRKGHSLGRTEVESFSGKVAPPQQIWGFRKALVTAVLNPKLGVFFVTVMPLFVPAHEPTRAVCLLFASIQSIEAIIWYVFIGSIASHAQELLRQDRIRRRIEKVSAVVFIALGLRVALDAE